MGKGGRWRSEDGDRRRRGRMGCGGERLADLIVSAGAAAEKNHIRLRVSQRCVQVWWDGVFDRPPGAGERNCRFPTDEEHSGGLGEKGFHRH